MTNRSLPAFLRSPRPVVVAHRGGGGLRPENTLPAFEHAVALGVDAIEMDVHRTSDGDLVVLHDEHVDRVSDGSGLVAESDLASLRGLDAGYRFTLDGGRSFPWRGRGVRIPTLEEVCRLPTEVGLSVEVKPRDPEVARAVLALLRDLGADSRACVGSFHPEVAALVRTEAPDVATAATPGEVRRAVLLGCVGLGRFAPGGADVYAVPERSEEGRSVVSPRFVNDLARRGRPVHVWTVDEEEDMRRLLDWHVRGIVTNRPDRALALLGR